MTLNKVELSVSEFHLFQNFIFEQAGILMAEHKRHLVANRLMKRLRLLHILHYAEYFDLVQHNPEEKQLAVDLLTTNETYFFREPKHFDFIQHKVLAHWPQNKLLRCWSAAASTGEESYSLAMLFDNILGLTPWEIFATDINHSVLETAKVGHYMMDRIEGIPANFLKKYCLKGTGKFTGSLLVDPKIRQRVNFSALNLTKQLPEMGKFDVIFLRNVMIYFDNDTKEELIQRVTGKLANNGLLFVGHTESIKSIKHGLVEVQPSIYRNEKGTS
ncbi:MAG: SAM-dependent methyltransferase [Colwellia sp.]|nr:SAM-dependent methyltransferase [Colwellia sp.]